MQHLRPLNEEHLRECVAFALGAEQPLRIVGLDSKNGLGRPMAAMARLDLSALTGIVMYEPEELVMTARAATPLAEIEAALDASGQYLAFEPPHLGRLYDSEPRGGSIGAAFACNLGGPRRFRAGAARDHLLGFQAVSGRAEIFKSGGRVVKNVTGYDLSKLVCGSHGTLAALSEVTFKILPKPEKVWTALALGLDLAAAVPAMAEAASASHEISGLCYLPAALAARSSVDHVAGAGVPVLAMRLEGPAPSVAERMAALKSSFGRGCAIEELHSRRSVEFWREIRDARLLTVNETRAVWRVSLTPTLAGDYLAAVQRRTGAEGFLDWAGGLVWLATAVDDGNDGGETVVRGALTDGHATLMRGPERLRARISVFQPQPAPVAALNRRIREGFDPKGIFNPGRMTEIA